MKKKLSMWVLSLVAIVLETRPWGAEFSDGALTARLILLNPA